MPVGPSPFSSDFSEWYQKKRHSGNKKEFKVLQAGYPTRKLKSNLTGDVYLLPRQDYEELVKYFGEHHSELSEGYNNGKQLYRKIQTPADYIDYAFEKKSQQKQLITQECQGGHIKAITYNSLYMLLMVEFTNRGDVCVFFNLPANVASTLLYLAKNNTMAPPDKNGRERHAVGVEFWNLVRVRGSIHDTRFPFQYTKDFRTGEAFGRREGYGPDGGVSKWIYNKDPVPDARFKNKDDVDAKLRTTPFRIKREDYERQSSMLEEEAKRDSYAGEDKFESLTEDDLAYYFDKGNYNKDLVRVDGSNRKKLQSIYDKYMAEDYGEPDEIGNMLRKAGAII